MPGKIQLPKISRREAQKMIRHGFALTHISWFTPRTGMSVNYPEEYPDCSHILTDSGHGRATHWRNVMSHAAAVIEDKEYDESLYELEQKRLWGQEPKEEWKFEPFEAVKDITDKLRLPLREAKKHIEESGLGLPVEDSYINAEDLPEVTDEQRQKFLDNPNVTVGPPLRGKDGSG